MTRRERLEAVINNEITEELIEECKKELEKLDNRSAAALAKTKESAHYKENKDYEAQICAILTDEPLQIEEIKEKLNLNVTRQRLTGICTNLIKDGKAATVELKVKGKGKRKGYVKA